MSTRWLFLDFDNTLMNTEQYVLPTLIDYFNELYADQAPEPLTLEIFKKNFHGLAREGLCKAMSDFYGFNVDYPTLFKDREWNVQRQYKALDSGVEMAANMIETLTALKKEGYKLVSVSNSPIQRTLAAMRFASCGQGHDLASLFGAHFFEAGDIQKPDPTVYLRAIEQVDADPVQSFAVEDSVSGTKAAIGAGLICFGYTGFADDHAVMTQKLLEAGCSATFQDWATFPVLLKQRT